MLTHLVLYSSFNIINSEITGGKVVTTSNVNKLLIYCTLTTNQSNSASYPQWQGK